MLRRWPPSTVSLGPAVAHLTMMLQPRKFKYKTRHKLRSASNPSEPVLKYGSVALVILKPVRISAKRIYRLKLFLKRSSRKSDVTRRAFWVSIFPHLPLSRKPKGMRMGKGAGKLATWFTQIRGGKHIVEFKNLRLGRAIYYGKQVSHKLPVPTTIHRNSTRNIQLTQGRATNPDLQMYW